MTTTRLVVRITLLVIIWAAIAYVLWHYGIKAIA
jgi:hypothetical protein